MDEAGLCLRGRSRLPFARFFSGRAHGGVLNKRQSLRYNRLGASLPSHSALARPLSEDHLAAFLAAGHSLQRPADAGATQAEAVILAEQGAMIGAL